jgi:hypothetical protein
MKRTIINSYYLLITKYRNNRPVLSSSYSGEIINIKFVWFIRNLWLGRSHNLPLFHNYHRKAVIISRSLIPWNIGESKIESYLILPDGKCIYALPRERRRFNIQINNEMKWFLAEIKSIFGTLKISRCIKYNEKRLMCESLSIESTAIVTNLPYILIVACDEREWTECLRILLEIKIPSLLEAHR